MTQKSDVKLLNGQVKVEAWDLCLDSQDRRKNNTQHRRALVHDPKDGLTLNWNKDYPGGVTIAGDTKIEGNLSVNNGLFRAQVQYLDGWEFLGNPPAIHLRAEDLVLINRSIEDQSKRNVALSHTSGDKLIVNRNKGYEGGVEIHGTVNVQDSMIFGPSLRLPKLKTPFLTISPESIKAHNVKVESSGSIPGKGMSIMGTQYIEVDLIHEILDLKKQIENLKTRLKALES